MSPTAPTTTRYFDKLGRPIRTEVEAFEGDNPRRVDAFYDARGRLACESAPYHSDETPHYTKYAYDVRDRVTAVTRPDGGSTAIVYKAVSATHRVKATATETVKKEGGTVADTRASERLYNILGELVEATDGVRADVGGQGDDDLRVRHLGAAEDGDGGRRGDELRVRRGGQPRERDEPGHGDGGRRQEREVQVHGSGPGARARRTVAGRRHTRTICSAGRPAAWTRPPGRKRSRRRGATTRRTARGDWRAAATAGRRSRRHTRTTWIRRGWRRYDDHDPGREYDRPATSRATATTVWAVRRRRPIRRT